MAGDINWFELRRKLEELGEPNVLHLSKAELLERVKKLYSPHAATHSAIPRSAPPPSARVAALMALVARGIRSGVQHGYQVITHLDDGSGLLICRREAHPFERGGPPVEHWNIEVQGIDPHGHRSNKIVLNLHIILDKNGEITDAYF